MTASEPTILSFVSGKGGVGKTLLSSNFAWLCSRIARTLIIDLDFQNQGCTGLFLNLLPHQTHGVLHYLRSPGEQIEPAEIATQLWFLPASSVHDAVQAGNTAELLHSAEILDLLTAFLARVCALRCYDVIVLDCHGGLDYTSVAAYSLSQHTILVGEANAVAFNGTLELLSFYDLHSKRPVPDLAQAKGAEVPGGAIHFIINRLAPKYLYDDIAQVYDGLLAGYKGPLRLARNVLSFIPDESFIAESYGDYPFLIELAPWSVTAKKIDLLVVTLLPFDPGRFATFKPLHAIDTPGARRKIRRRVISTENASVQMVLQAYGWLTVLIFLLVIAEFVGILSSPADPGTALDKLVRNPYVVVLLVLTGILCAVFTVRAQIGVKRYYRELFKFRKSLLRVRAVRRGPWQFLSLMRLRVMWTCSALVVYGIYFVVGLYCFIGLVVGAGALVGKAP